MAQTVSGRSILPLRSWGRRPRYQPDIWELDVGSLGHNNWGTRPEVLERIVELEWFGVVGSLGKHHYIQLDT